MQYGNRHSNQIGPELQAYYDTLWLENAIEGNIYEKFYTITKTLPQNSTEEIKFRKWIDPRELYLAGRNVNNDITGNATGAGERTFSLMPEGEYNKFILPEGSSGDSKQTMKYIEMSATVFPIGDWMPETEELNLLHPVYTTEEAVKQMGVLSGTVIDSFYRDQMRYGASQVKDISADGAGKDNVKDNAFTEELRKMYVVLQLSGAKPLKHVISSHINFSTTPIHTTYIGVVHPLVMSAFEENEKFVPVEEYPAVALMENEGGKIGQFRFVSNPNAPLELNADGSYKTDIMVFGADHSATVPLRGKGRAEVIFKPLGSAGIGDALNRKATVGWKTWLGAKTLYPERLGKITVNANF